VKDTAAPARLLGDLLQDFIGRVAHRSGRTLSILSQASVTLQQVILLRRLDEMRESTVSALAERLGMSLPSVSQMVDRLHRLGLVSRTEAGDDRRKKHIALTPGGRALIDLLETARAEEFEIGFALLSASVQARLAEALSEALRELG
jgi:DNA-binding MarR family transcriptional regulator